MQIIVIGGSGTIGKKVTAELAKRHDVLVAGRNSGDFRVNIDERDSINDLFETVENIDAVICAAGNAKWDLLKNLTEEDFYVGIRSKLMGQVNLARIAFQYLNDGGSVTLSTGILAEDPVVMTTSAAMVNGAIHSFVKAAALEAERGVRINAVAAGLVEDAVEKYREYFPGHNPVPMDRVINGYLRSVEGANSGEVIRVYA